MFIINWLRRWMQNRNRAIYRYWDGSRSRSIDPWYAFRQLSAHSEFDWETTPGLADANDAEAIELMLRAVREVFGLQSFVDGRGLTDAETILLLTDFTMYTTALKKNISQSPILPESTEPRPSDASITNADSDCGSISTEPSNVASVPS